MGITGLLPLVKEACIDQVHLSDLSNTVAVIDTYCWLHRALVGAAYDVYKGNSVTAHVDFCFRKIEELKKYNIKPIFVFDGRNLPAKKETEEIRRANRKKAKEQLDSLFAKGDTKTAYKILPRAIDISQEMAKQLIDRLIEAEIDYIVAPYEADAQIAYLIRNGFAHFAISEDSDLILYGCDYVFYKLSSEGTGVLYRNDQVLNCLGEDSYRFNMEKFKRMCILSGCDYLPNLPGIGLMKAKKFFSKLTRNDNIERELEKLPTILNMKKLTVPKEYIKKFFEAENVFNHQLIYCPKEKKLKPFSDYGENHVKEHLEYAGSYLDDDQALNLVLGNVNFSNMEIYDNSLIEKLEKKYFNSKKSIWNESYEPVNRRIFEEIIKKQLDSNYEMPEELLSIHKRKYNEDNVYTEIIDKKKAKISTSFVNSSLAYSEDDEVIVDGSFKSENTSIKTDSTPSSVKVEVKSRFFAKSNDEEKSPSDLERIKNNKKAIRESLKKLYTSKESSSPLSTQDSGFCSSQQSQ